MQNICHGVFLMSDNLEDKIIENAMSPKSAEVDGQKVEQHSLTEQIEADRYLANKRAAKSRSFGLRIGKMVHGGAE